MGLRWHGVFVVFGGIFQEKHLKARVNHVGARILMCTGMQLQTIKGALYETLRQIRPNAVAYVDAFGLTDYLLNSALGREVCRIKAAACNYQPPAGMHRMGTCTERCTTWRKRRRSMRVQRVLPGSLF